VPVEHRLRRDQERAPPLTGDKAGEQGDERPVRPVEARPAELGAQHFHLGAQDEYLAVEPRACTHKPGTHPITSRIGVAPRSGLIS
jgi:hypothetical protein